MASWISPGPSGAPQAMSAQALVAGQYDTGPGSIGLKMNIHLPVDEAMSFETSIEGTVSTVTSVPSLSRRGFFLLALGLVGLGIFAAPRWRRTRA